MDLTKVYKDSEGLELSIYQMVRREPDWAANRLQEGELAIEELATLKAESAEKSDNKQSAPCLCPVDGSPLTPVFRCELHDLTFYKR